MQKILSFITQHFLTILAISAVVLIGLCIGAFIYSFFVEAGSRFTLWNSCISLLTLIILVFSFAVASRQFTVASQQFAVALQKYEEDKQNDDMITKRELYKPTRVSLSRIAVLNEEIAVTINDFSITSSVFHEIIDEIRNLRYFCTVGDFYDFYKNPDNEKIILQAIRHGRGKIEYLQTLETKVNEMELELRNLVRFPFTSALLELLYNNIQEVAKVYIPDTQLFRYGYSVPESRANFPANKLFFQAVKAECTEQVQEYLDSRPLFMLAYKLIREVIKPLVEMPDDKLHACENEQRISYERIMENQANTISGEEDLTKMSASRLIKRVGLDPSRGDTGKLVNLCESFDEKRKN